ncbi:ATP-binding protein [Cellulosimicrobium marinum]|uniref:ATP-binding protein n=1 Tax=Cellulosimicrobium marinum TaxID=1638992 RepID=UPI001E5C1724|nr:ATP-binding protein [Cellulosimicrobium marinum]MCB7135338.1 ATP-binding protein [Cellulosimicrobium marinum]
MTIARIPVPPRFVEIGSWPLLSMADLAPLRADLHRMLTGTPCPPDRPLDAPQERIVLVASELATNALRHSAPPARVLLLSDGREIVVDVVDHSPDASPRLAPGRPPGAGGFGLQLARRTAQEVGWFSTLAGEKHVWARFAVPVFRAGATTRSAFALQG